VTRPILPGSTVGVLGSGQLGRMFAIAARRMGYRVHTLSPDDDTPTGQIADVEVVASYEDLEAIRRFARGVDVVTFEFENVPAAAVRAAAAEVPVRPKGAVLETTQQRVREKRFLEENGFPVAAFAPVATAEELARAAERVGIPAVLKSAAFGYDGKGQRRIASGGDAMPAWDSLGRPESILEAFVDFERELSVIVGRGLDGALCDWGVFENRHERHILDVTVAPARVDAAASEEAIAIARRVADRLDLVGVICVEMFQARDGRLLINELAPRPHNSGHLTFDAAVTSQFEQQLRAVCGLPLGSTALHSPAAMANLLGDLWERGEPDWAAAAADPDVKIHLYGKLEPRPGRKMGHLTALAATADEAERKVLAARARLTR
jgi:5-(carboxyamino)imidazole ribonucleotide synthase